MQIKQKKNFYDELYYKEEYSSEKYLGNRVEWLQELVTRTEGQNGAVLEIGCGRGHLQHVAPGYVGLDISTEAGRYLEKPFICGLAQALPFADQTFDLGMSFTVLEHLSRPEEALQEMSRVLKKGGQLVLSAAWRVPLWRPLGLEIRKYKGLPWQQKVMKFCLPLLNRVWTQGSLRIPLRLIRELKFFLFFKESCPLSYTGMKPNWQEFLLPDSDAAVSMDNHACALWLYSRGFRSPETQGAFQRVFLRCLPLIMVKT